MEETLIATFASFIEVMNVSSPSLVQCTRHFPICYSITFRFLALNAVDECHKRTTSLDIGREMPINFIDMGLPPTSSLHSTDGVGGDHGCGWMLRDGAGSRDRSLIGSLVTSRQNVPFRAKSSLKLSPLYSPMLCFVSRQNLLLPANILSFPPHHNHHELMHRHLTTSSHQIADCHLPLS